MRDVVDEEAENSMDRLCEVVVDNHERKNIDISREEQVALQQVA